MSRSTTFSLRPLDKREWKGTLEGAFRVHLNRQDMIALDLQSGDFCRISKPAGTSGLAVAWPSPDPKLSQRIIRVSDTLREVYQFSLEDRVHIEKSEDARIRATAVHISALDERPLSEGFRNAKALTFAITGALASLETLCSGASFEVQLKLTPARRRQGRLFHIAEIDPPTENPTLYVFDEETAVVLPEGEALATPPSNRTPVSAQINEEGIGGLEQQIKLLNDQLLSVLTPDQPWHFVMPSGVHRSRGIVLYGPEGTGKTLLLERFAEASWKKVFRVDESVLGLKASESCKALEKIFAEARSMQPTLIAFDGFEELFGNAEDQGGGSRVVGTLVSEMRRSVGTAVVVVATALSLGALPKRLRAADTFRITIEIPMPDARTRTAIVNAILQTTQHQQLAQRVGETTHGFTGRDLLELCTVSLERTQKRLEKVISDTEGKTILEQAGQDKIVYLVDHLTEGDFDDAKLTVRPTPMKEVFLETPKITWDDIGGAEHVREALRKVTVYPFKYPEAMEAIGLAPQKGILLYGPPGCSKTLIAQAVANQGGLNFLAVKGAELLNMYVGESERAIREVFRKARAASPSVIFFDEIDAIGRSDRGSGRTNGLNVVTTLLNEMDGIESLSNVLVLAATNAPEVLDPALMRPGRMDTILYVGPPNFNARKEILVLRCRTRPLAEDVNFDGLAERTDGYSGAEVVRICDVAAENAFDEWEKGDQTSTPVISQRHFDFALENVVKQITPAMRLRFENWQPGGVTKLLQSW